MYAPIEWLVNGNFKPDWLPDEARAESRAWGRASGSLSSGNKGQAPYWPGVSPRIPYIANPNETSVVGTTIASSAKNTAA